MNNLEKNRVITMINYIFSGGVHFPRRTIVGKYV
jgi:hypothetical protein